jgi:DNA-binding transcriptional LysR family regulator
MLDKLDFVLALAREKHFGRAAEACGVTQPTLSAGLKQLEAQMGVLLVNRGSRFQSFTPEGERVLEWARRIVGDARAMRGERHPNVQFTIYSRTSIEILDLLENLEIDAGITYLGNEPLGRVSAIPLYQERYRLLTSADAPLGDRDRVTWAEVAQVPLCLLTPDMQNRRIIDRLLLSAGGESRPTLESDSMILLYSHVRTGRWASVMPAKLAETLGLTDTLRAIPIIEPQAVQTIGLVVPAREPMTPLTAALVEQAQRVAPELEEVEPVAWAKARMPRRRHTRGRR